MNLLTGVLVCLMTLGIGIGMMVVGSQKVRESSDGDDTTGRGSL